MRTLSIIILFLHFNLLLSHIAEAQQKVDFNALVKAAQHEAHVHDYSSYFSESSNEVSVLLTAFFIGYKNFFSSQDARSCTFEPSCSVYAIEIIRRKGIFAGFLDAIDRLTRCNGLSPEDYEIDQEKRLLIDKP